MTEEQLSELYANGIARGAEKVAARVGPEAAERWKRASIAQARKYAASYAKAPRLRRGARV